MNDYEKLVGEAKVVVESSTGRHVFQKTGESTLEYSLDESEPEQFPTPELIQQLEEDGYEVADIFPIEFTLYANDDSNTQGMLRQKGLPTEDEALYDLLYYYPGEIEVTYRLERGDTRPYELTAVEFVYEGTTFTPEED